MEIGDVEKLLDKEIHKYNYGIHDFHPMRGVTYDDTARQYKIRYDGLTTNTSTLAVACEKIEEKLQDKHQESLLKNENFCKKFFLYNGHYFMTYWYKDNPYFDIHHIISVLNLTKSYFTDKYNKFALILSTIYGIKIDLVDVFCVNSSVKK